MENLKIESKSKSPKLSFGFLKSKKFWTLCIIGVLILIVVLPRIFGKSKGQAVSIYDVLRKDLVQSISVTGTIEANKSEITLLNTSQKVIEVFVEEGQKVKKGDPLVKLDTEDLEYQLQRAKVSLSAAEISDKTGLKSAADSVSQAEINLEKAKRDLDMVKMSFEANQALYDKGFISKYEYDTSKKQLADAENAVKLAEIQLSSAKTTYDNYSKGSQQKQQLELYRADVKNLEKKIADSTIKAGIDGTVVKMDAVENQYLQQSKNIVMVADLSSYKLVVSLSQYDSTRAAVGQKAKIKVKGIEGEYDGTVTKIGEIAGVTTSGVNVESKVEIEITISNPDNMIKAGYEADAEIILQEKDDALTVSYDCIREDEKGKYVFTVVEGKALKKYVKAGVETDFDVEILDGLTKGDICIVNPPETLNDGDAVTVDGGNY